MNKAHQIINEISDTQGKELLELAVYEMKKAGVQPMILDTKDLDEETYSKLSKPILKELTIGDDELALFLRKQLIDNEFFLMNQRADDPHRSISVSTLLLLPIVLSFLKVKYSTEEIDGKRNSFLTIELVSLEGLLRNSSVENSPNFSNKNAVENSHLQTEKGNIHIGDVTNVYHGVGSSGASSSSSLNEMQSIKKDLEQEIAQGNIGKVIDELLKYFEDENEDLYQEVLVLSAKWNRLEKERRLGLSSVSENNLVDSKIINSLLHYLNQL